MLYLLVVVLGNAYGNTMSMVTFQNANFCLTARAKITEYANQHSGIWHGVRLDSADCLPITPQE